MGRPSSITIAAHSSLMDKLIAQEQQQIYDVQANQAIDRIVFLTGEVNEQSVAVAVSQLVNFANNNSSVPVHLVLNTYGGSIDEMFSLYDIMRFLPCKVCTVGLGKVMSAGVLLLAAGEYGKRLIGKSARVMIHPISASYFGNVFQMVNEAKEIQRLQDMMVDSLASMTNLSKAQLGKIMKKGADHYIEPNDAVKYGIVDSIIG